MQMKPGEVGKMHPLLQLSQKQPLAFTIQSFCNSLGTIVVVHHLGVKRKWYSKK